MFLLWTSRTRPAHFLAIPFRRVTRWKAERYAERLRRDGSPKCEPSVNWNNTRAI